MHRNHPQKARMALEMSCVLRTQSIFLQPVRARSFARSTRIRLDKIVHNVSDHSLIRPKGAPFRLNVCTFEPRITNPVRTIGRTTGFSSIHEFPHGQTSITRVQRRNRT
jgi:hypothetical protein